MTPLKELFLLSAIKFLLEETYCPEKNEFIADDYFTKWFMIATIYKQAFFAKGNKNDKASSKSSA
jgi:hypothetical protein